MAQLSDDCFAFGGPMLSVEDAVALLASRTNFVLSIPMLMCMASASHGLPFLTP